MKYDVFISHSSKDADVADQLCKYLEENGIKCWISPRDVTAGMPYSRAILQGIDDSHLMLLLFSDHANNSRHIESEVDRAFNKEKTIIPFRITNTIMSDVLSYYLGASHYIDGIPNPSSSFGKLKIQIERNLPNHQGKMDIEEMLLKLAELKGLSVEELRTAIEELRTSADDAFEDLLNDFIKADSEGNHGNKEPLPNKLGQKGKYSIIQNSEGEIMIMMISREGDPENPRFIYDGKDVALLYRNQESSVAFRYIDEKARAVLMNVKEIIVVEVTGEDVEREYMVPVRIVKDVNNLIIK